MLETEKIGTTNLNRESPQKRSVDLQKVTQIEIVAAPKLLVVLLGKGPSWASARRFDKITEITDAKASICLNALR